MEARIQGNASMCAYERVICQDEFSRLHDAPLIAAYDEDTTVPCIHADGIRC